MIRDLILRNRSYRRFYEDYAIEKNTLMELVDLARVSSSAKNLQPLKYMLSCDSKKNLTIFSHLAWAGYIKDWPGPGEGERPAAYIIILGDTDITKTFECDCGIAAENILLGAVEKGLGGCMVGTVKRDNLRKALGIPDRLEILLVIALGKPKEKVVLDIAEEGADIKYWREKDKTHHVPKRKLKDIIIEV